MLSCEEPLREDLDIHRGGGRDPRFRCCCGQHHDVIVDVPRIPAAPYRWALDNADFRMIVADQTLRSVRDATRLRAALAEDDELRNLLVVNRHGEGGRHAVTLQEMQHVLGLRAELRHPVQPASFATAINSGSPRRLARQVRRTRLPLWRSTLSGGQPERRRWWRAEMSRRASAAASSSAAGHELVLIPGEAATGRRPGSTIAATSRSGSGTADVADRPVGGGPHPADDAEGRNRQARSARSRPSERVQLNEIEEATLAAELTDDMVGLGPLEPFLDDDEVTDILVNGPFDIYVERHGKLEKTDARFRDAQHLVNVAQRIAAAVGRRIDEASPMVDARLADGSRVNIVLPPLVLNGGTISIRKFPKQSMTLDAMVRQAEPVAPRWRGFCRSRRAARLNILISGGTGSGKTTLLNAVSQYIDRDERIITIEDAVELRLQQPHVVQMETRPPNIEGRRPGPAARARPQCAAHAARPHHRRRGARPRSLRHAAGDEYRA